MDDTIDASAVADAIANVVGPSAAFMGNPPPPLPEGWVLKESRSNPGCYYYYNLLLGVSSWQPPVLENDEQARPPPPDEEAENVAPPQDNNSQPESSKTPPAEQEKDPEVAEDRSSKRHKPQSSSSSSGPKEVRVLHILKKHKGSRRPSSWRQAKITSTKEEATEELLGLLEIIKEEDVFAKAFCIICITINPGTKKIVNLCPRTSALPFPTAKLKTAKKRKKVTTGDKIVCIQTLKNLNTSLI